MRSSTKEKRYNSQSSQQCQGAMKSSWRHLTLHNRHSIALSSFPCQHFSLIAALLASIPHQTGNCLKFEKILVMWNFVRIHLDSSQIWNNVLLIYWLISFRCNKAPAPKSHEILMTVYLKTTSTTLWCHRVALHAIKQSWQFLQFIPFLTQKCGDCKCIILHLLISNVKTGMSFCTQ